MGLQTFRAEFRPTLRLAIPLVLAELGWMSMAIVDTMMVGRLPNSATAMGAVSLGSNIFIVLALFGGGLLLGLDTLVAQAYGRKPSGPGSVVYPLNLQWQIYVPGLNKQQGMASQ